MKNLRIILCLLILFSQTFARIIYVDNTLAGDEVGSYDPGDRDGSGSDIAYNTLQDVIWGTDGTDEAGALGDTCYVRGDSTTYTIYQENL